MQLLTISFKRLDSSVRAGELDRAEGYLRIATTACWGSAWLLTYTGDFSKAEYDTQIVPTMKPPHMSIPDFSALMSLDHSHLVRLIQEMRPTLGALPSRLQPAFRDLVRAYDAMMQAHFILCDRLGGSERPSIRMAEKSTKPSTEILAEIMRKRLEALKAGSEKPLTCPHRHS
jgi:hypothetical protein